MTAVNLGEVVGGLVRAGMEETDIREALRVLSTDWIAFDDDLAYATGLLITATRTAGLSFGDRACLALAKRLGAKALTADRAWAKVAPAIGVEVEFVR